MTDRPMSHQPTSGRPTEDAALERRLRDWYVDGVREAETAPASLRAALASLPTSEPWRRRSGILDRLRGVGTGRRLAIGSAAAAGVVAVALLAGLLPGLTLPLGTPTDEPDSSSPPTASTVAPSSAAPSSPPATPASTPAVTPAPTSAPTSGPTPAPAVNAIRPRFIAAGARHTCGLRMDGTVACWGSGESFATGSIPNGADRSTPQAIRELSDVVAITAGADHTCALLIDGAVMCWGGNRDSQLGNGTKTDAEASPVQVLDLPPAIAIDGGTEHTCAIVRNGRAFCWGENRDRQLGDGATTDRLLPVRVEGVGNAVSIAAGGSHSCAALAGGTVWCWGSNARGQLGDGTTEPRSGVAQAAGVGGAVEVSVGDHHSCALIDDGSMRCWGSNHQGQTGSGAISAADPLHELPVSVEGVTDAVAVAAGGLHTCALLADRSVLCWGYDNAGQVGRGGEFPIDEEAALVAGPVEVVGLHGATGIAAGSYAHTCALLTDGRAACWGINDYGELGDGGEVGGSERRVPVPVVEFDVDEPGP